MFVHHQNKFDAGGETPTELDGCIWGTVAPRLLDGDLAGLLARGGDLAGLLALDGDLAGLPDLDGDLAGLLDLDGDLLGAVEGDLCLREAPAGVERWPCILADIC